MENASKALIIAGAILISILLISVGVLIMNSMDPMKDAAGQQSESMAIQTYNAQFTAFEGQGKSASEIRSLFSTMNASNASNTAQVSVATDAAAVKSSAQLKSNTEYDVYLNYNKTTGYVSSILVVTSGTACAQDADGVWKITGGAG